MSDAALCQPAPWQGDGEDASRSWYVAGSECSLICLNAAPRNRKSKSESGLILAAMREGQKHFVQVAGRKAAAVIMDINQDTVGGRIGVQYNFGVAPCELERVLQ